MKHREKHPFLDQPDCFGCRVATIFIGADALPTRKSYCKTTEARDRLLHKDLAAYKRLRQDGTQPRQIDGSAMIEARANEKWQVEGTPA